MTETHTLAELNDLLRDCERIRAVVSGRAEWDKYEEHSKELKKRIEELEKQQEP